MRVCMESPGTGGKTLFRLFQHGFLPGDHRDSAGRYGISLAVFFRVEPDHGMLGQLHVPVNDCVADARIAADIHVIVDDRVLHVTEAVHTHVVAHHGSPHAPAGNDGAARHDGVERHAHA